ncbi:hypothetical protein [Demequina rhizosphaerae]|uniref:hypothetical protein n=1 Tax=Demequina rhizosphaerae TaxID=1638985 RepID=UPI000780313C|nr:hypothetical protein [Demequina rhizosphaerae]
MPNEATIASSGSGISRRRLVQGAAWATPAVLIATAAPAGANGSGAFAPTLSVTRGGSGLTRSATLIHRVDNASAYDVTTITLTFYLRKTTTGSGYNKVSTGDFDSASATGWSTPVIGTSPTDPSVGTVTFMWSSALSDGNSANSVTLVLKSSGTRPSFLASGAVEASATSQAGAAAIEYL